MKINRQQWLLLGASFLTLLTGGAALFTAFALRQKKSVAPQMGEAAISQPTAPLFLTQAPDEIEDKVIAKVGHEKIYGVDLIKMLEYYFPKEATFSASTREEALEKAFEQSIILQEVEKEGKISFNDYVFNSPNKNYRERNLLIEEAEKKIKEENLKAIEGRYVSIWFYNVEPPSIGLTEAKKIAREKIEVLYPELVSESLSFEEAAWQLYRDSQVAQITEPHSAVSTVPSELSETGSCYGKFYLGGEAYGMGTSFKGNENLEKKVRELKEGEVSSIIIGKDGNYEEGQELYEAFFAIYTVDKIRNPQGRETMAEWLTQKKEEYEIIYY